MTDDQFAQPADDPIEADAVGADPMSSQDPPQYGVGPFTIREVALLGVWLAAFVVSFFPVYTDLVGRALGGGLSVWVMGLDWILTIGVPTVAMFLVVLRRFSPQGIRRVGSLGIDQFASVAFTVSATVWLVALWHNVAVVISDGVWVRTWVVWVEFFLMLAGVVLTVAAPLIPVLAEDFRGRPETPAHRSARPVRAVTPRPPRPKPAPAPAADPYAAPDQDEAQAVPPAEGTFTAEEAYGRAGDEVTASAGAPADPTVRPEPLDDALTVTGAYRALGFEGERRDEPVADEFAAGPRYARSEPEPEPEPQPEPEPEPQRTAHQAFWALAPEERDVHDEHGVPIFRIGPTAWALVIEDRGSLFVIRHEDGRIGYLHDVTGVTRG
ncbi:hypothetical protein [Microbacterium sp.]|uniref:hypothetical protein n=1 Tax=Microbacterium sp. TaxID=51671 RepID=UPI0037CC529B